mmetsp:Transcript_8897/g.17935  ORF Transcript_8897/g.17935 Transcript_8897/m.17935 type:complete len:147 (-) Transcript_8897:158-598(-)
MQGNHREEVGGDGEESAFRMDNVEVKEFDEDQDDDFQENGEPPERESSPDMAEVEHLLREGQEQLRRSEVENLRLKAKVQDEFAQLEGIAETMGRDLFVRVVMNRVPDDKRDTVAALLEGIVREGSDSRTSFEHIWRSLGSPSPEL